MSSSFCAKLLYVSKRAAQRHFRKWPSVMTVFINTLLSGGKLDYYGPVGQYKSDLPIALNVWVAELGSSGSASAENPPLSLLQSEFVYFDC